MITITRQPLQPPVTPGEGALRFDEPQTLSDLERVQAAANSGFVYDATKGGFVIPIGDGIQAFIPIASVPD